MPDKQTTIDWGNIKRFMRQAWIAKLRIPETQYERNGRVQMCVPRRMKSLLTVLEAHARDKHSCHLKQPTIAIAMGAGVRTVARAIEDCQALELIMVESSFFAPAASKYIINWTKVAQLLLACPETAKDVPVQELESESNDDITSATVADVAGQSPLPPCQSPLPPCQSPLPPCQSTSATLSQNDEEHTSSRVRGEASLQASSKQDLNQSYDREALERAAEKAKRSRNGRKDEGNGGWPYRITPQVFAFDFSIQSLWDFALDQPWGLGDQERIKFFTLCHCLARLAPKRKASGKPIKNLTALFTYLVKGRRWQGTDGDVRRAVESIARLDKRVVQEVFS